MPISDGHYARKQIFSRSRIISWSHRRRFQVGLDLASALSGQQLLDYGCGDGTFLAMLMERKDSPASAVGAEIDDSVVADCRKRLGADARLSFSRTDALDSTFDGLVCMEVMEHVVEREPIFEQWKSLVRPGGLILVSVPVETGPVLIAKQTIRRVAGWRGIGDYPGIAPYSWVEYLRSIFARSSQHITRPVHPGGTYCHKGFNWRLLRGELGRHFDLERTVSSPIHCLPAGLGSQVWFVLRNRPSMSPSST